MLEALTDGKKRTGFDPGIPEIVKERAKGAATVRHWVRYGKLYGWFRKTFDRVYVKLAGFAQKVKEKVKKLAGSAGSSGFGNWIKAAALALFKVAKKIGAWAVSIIVDKLLDSLQEGVINIIKQLAEAATPEAVKSKIEEVKDLKAKFEQMLQEAQEKLEKRLFGDKLEMFSKLDKYMDDREHGQHDRERGEVGHPHRRVRLAAAPRLSVEPRHSRARVRVLQDHGDVLVLGEGLRLGQGQRHPARYSTSPPRWHRPSRKDQQGAAAARGHRPAVRADHHQSQGVRYRLQGGGDGDGGGPEPTEEQKALMEVAKEVGDTQVRGVSGDGRQACG